jgi:pimeloyl-ACP methyl ester carboxylesterase
MRRTVLDARSGDLQTVINRGKAEHPSWSDDEWQPWADAKQHVSLQFMDEMATVPPAANWRELLGRVNVPTLLITSDPERGGIVTPEASAEAQQILPSLKAIRIEGAGHNIRREQFDPFLAAATSFLKTYAGAAPLTRR